MGINNQAILALASGTLTLIVFGSLYTFGALTPYISSYLYYQNDETSSSALSILFTLTFVTVNVGIVLSTLFLSKLSNRIQCIIAVICMSGSVFGASFMTTFFGFCVFYGLFYGISIGIGYFPPVKNCYLHLPTRKGLCSGVCMSGFGLGSAIFNYLIVGLINPNDISVDPVTKKYPLQIANNVPFALKMLAITYLATGILGAVFIIPPKQKKNKNISLLSQGTLIDQSITNQQKNQPTSTKQKQQKTLTKSQMLKVFIQKKAYFVIIQYVCVVSYGIFVAFNYKRLAFDRNSYFLQNDHLITTVGSIGIFCNGVFRSAWGYFFDHFSFKKIMITINVCLIFSCILILFAVQNVVAYFFIIPLTYLSYGGLYALLPTQSVRLLGAQIGAKMFWLIFSGFSIGAVLQFVIQYLILTNLKNDGYIYCMGTFLVLQIFGLIIGICVKFQYEQQQQKLMIKNKKQNKLQQNQVPQ